MSFRIMSYVPQRCGYRPVSKLAREGVQAGQLT